MIAMSFTHRWLKLLVIIIHNSIMSGTEKKAHLHYAGRMYGIILFLQVNIKTGTYMYFMLAYSFLYSCQHGLLPWVWEWLLVDLASPSQG